MAAITPPPSPAHEQIGFAIAHEVRNLLTPAKAYLQLGNHAAATKAINRALDFAEAVLSSGGDSECQVLAAVHDAIASLPPTGAVFHVERWAEASAAMPSAVLERILGNVLINSLQAASTEVKVRCFTWNEALRIQVTDDGPGRPSASAGPSRGRGLQICAFLLDQCGGRIEVNYQPGEGTTVNIDVPFSKSASQAA